MSTVKLVKPILSHVSQDGELLETIFDTHTQKTFFACKRGDDIQFLSKSSSQHTDYIPYPPTNSLLQNDIVLLASGIDKPVPITTIAEEIQTYIHKYVDVSPLFEKIASYYVLLSWVYDRFNELPYLRVRGDYGSGKTRFLLVVGALCYKPIFASGASTISPIFHMLDAIGGTLVIDEADFRFSDEKTDIVKLLNNGNVKGFPILRSEADPKKGFNPRAFHVFGPKLVATRGRYQDQALESRFITEDMSGRRLRDDIAVSLDSHYKHEAQQIRNKLLAFRFANFHAVKTKPHRVDGPMEPRLRQIFLPLLSLIDCETTRQDILDFAIDTNARSRSHQAMQIEVQILSILRDLLQASRTQPIAVKEIWALHQKKHTKHPADLITPRRIGSLLRNKFYLSTYKSNGNYLVHIPDVKQLEATMHRYGVSNADSLACPNIPLSATHRSIGP